MGRGNPPFIFCVNVLFIQVYILCFSFRRKSKVVYHSLPSFYHYNNAVRLREAHSHPAGFLSRVRSTWASQIVIWNSRGESSCKNGGGFWLTPSSHCNPFHTVFGALWPLGVVLGSESTGDFQKLRYIAIKYFISKPSSVDGSLFQRIAMLDFSGRSRAESS